MPGFKKYGVNQEEFLAEIFKINPFASYLLKLSAKNSYWFTTDFFYKLMHQHKWWIKPIYG